MKSSSYFQQQAESNVLASFGDARLVKHLNGTVELRGGSEEDQQAAREWLRQFMPAVLASLPCPPDRRSK
jgi:hypothetical protein